MATINDLIEIAGKNGRHCLNPIKWNELYERLPEKEQKGSGWEPPLPLILGAWHETPILAKILRFREHLEWADKHGIADEVYKFLAKLKEEEWYHGE